MLPSSTAARLLILVLVLGTGFVAVRRAIHEDNDFDGFHRAAVLVLEQGQLSGEKAVARYPPSFPVLMAPLGALPLGLAAALWFLINLGSMAALPRELARLGGVPPPLQRAAFLIAAPFLVDNLILGQSAPLLLWLSAAGVARSCGWRRGQRGGGLLGGGLLGLATAIKLLPLALLVVPVLRGRAWHTLAGFSLSLALVGGLCVLALGGDGTLHGLTNWQHTLLDQTPARLVDLDRSLRHGNQAIPIALYRTLGDTSGVREEFVPHLLDLPPVWLWRAWWVLLALALAAGGAAARAARRLGENATLPLFALVCLGLLFLSPLVWTHYFLWVLPALLALAAPWAGELSRGRLLRWGGWIYVLLLAVPPARSLGLHMLGALLLYALLVADLLRAARVAPAAAGSTRPQPLSSRAR